MAKGSNNLRGRSSDASKPYDVSNSFVKRVASRVTELLPQSTWLSRWISPASVPSSNDYLGNSLSSTIKSRPLATSRAELNLVDDVDHHIPAKKPRTSAQYSSPVNQKLLRHDGYSTEDISPIAVRGAGAGAGVVEPVAGPSSAQPEFISSTPAVRGQPQASNKVNGDDCSETSESTSGCSSLVPQAQSTNRSLGGSRYGRMLPLGSSIETMHSRRPSFCTTTFASPLRASMREKLGSSPFYSGRTMYGGSAQAYLPAIHSSQRRVGPTVKPMPAQQSQPLSATAKRILDALEQFSSPVMDAKRMPVIGTKRKAESGSQRYTDLSIPSTPDLLRVKQRERLQQSTSAARQAATASTPLASPSPAPIHHQTQYTIRKEEDDKKKPTGKLKSKDKPSADTLVEVKLPAAVLTVDKLPKIDIEVPPRPPPITTSYSTCLTQAKFKFSSPTAVPHTTTPAAVPSTSFKFSAPISESANSYKPVLTSSGSLSRTADDNEAHPKKRKSIDDISVEPLVNVVSGDMTKTNNLAKSSFKFPLPSNSGQSGCDIKIEGKAADSTSQMTCLVCKSKIKSEVCSLCKTKGSSKSYDTNKNTIINFPTSTTSFANLYKKPTGIWECPTCLIQNKNEANKCIACETGKPVAKKAISTSIDKKEVPNTSTTLPTKLSGFGDKFKKPSGNWECQACMVSNKPDSSNCVACETPKSGSQPKAISKPEISVDSKVSGSGFGNVFKKPSDSWTCDTCMIANDTSKVKCAACETPKPGVTLQKPLESSGPKFSFGIPSTTASNTSGVSSTFSFGIPKSDQTMDKVSSMTLPKANMSSESSKNQPIPPPTSSQTFSFGIPKTVKTDGESTITNSTSVPMFQFGSDKTSQTSLSESKSSNKITTGSNQSGSKLVFGSTLKKTPEESKKEVVKTVQTKPDLTKTSNVSSTSPAVSNATEQNTANFLMTAIKSNTAGSEKATAPLFSFGANKVKQNEEVQNKITSNSPQSSFSLGPNQWTNPSSTTNTPTSSAAPSNIFKFGETNTVASGGKGPSISSSTQPSFTVPKANNIFSFGSNNEKKNETNFGVKEPVQSSTVNATGNENKPVFGSLGATPSSSSVFGNTNTGNTFGSGSFNNKDQPPNPFVPQTTSNVFGAIETASVSSTGTFSGFAQASGFQTTTQENKAPVFSFGSSASTEKPNPTGGFIFNPVVEKRTEPSYNFSSNQVNHATTAFTGFNNTLPTPSTTFNFEPKPFGSGISSPFSAPANSTAPAPVFGTPTPVFGEQTNPNPMFTFGTQAAQQPQTPANPVFEFGSKPVMNQQQSTPVAPTPSTSFVFGANPAPAATPAFDPNAKPTFNFSQGNTPVFSAIPTVNSGITPQPPIRKIRKAVRRTNISSVRQT